jgi:glycosyltransferase involved in cell wall biosynthesis
LTTGRAPQLDAVVVVPARDEEERIEVCMRALASQSWPRERFVVVVVIDQCRDRTSDVVKRAALTLDLPVRMLAGPGSGAGAARKTGMDAACELLLAAGNPDGLIACTDADSQPSRDWLERQLGHTASGARAIAGLIELNDEESLALPAEVLERRAKDAARRLEQVRAVDPSAAHHHAAGASLSVTARTYRQVGGMAPLRALEDAGFADRLAEHRVRLLRPADVRVTTSARRSGRAMRGLSVDLAVSAWLERRRYRASQFTAGSLAAHKTEPITVIIPAKECADTIAGVLNRTVEPLSEAGLIDEILVVDAHSVDGTAEIAEAAGARVIDQDLVAGRFGPTLGKGDAMWRALQVTGGELVCFLDADTADPHPDHLLGLLGPLLLDPSVVLVKGAFDRPLHTAGGTLPHEGGRVTELMARPLLNLHAPLLAGFSQPLAGELAARRELLERISFPAGYGVEIAMLLDALRLHGLDALAECNLGTRQNRHQPLRALGEMAYAVLAAVETRLSEAPETRSAPSGRYLRPWEDGFLAPVPILERPPIATLALERSALDKANIQVA